MWGFKISRFHSVYVLMYINKWKTGVKYLFNNLKHETGESHGSCRHPGIQWRCCLVKFKMLSYSSQSHSWKSARHSESQSVSHSLLGNSNRSDHIPAARRQLTLQQRLSFTQVPLAGSEVTAPHNNTTQILSDENLQSYFCFFINNWQVLSLSSSITGSRLLFLSFCMNVGEKLFCVKQTISRQSCTTGSSLINTFSASNRDYDSLQLHICR